MPSSSHSTPSVSRARQTPKPVSEARPAASRVTRLRSGKEGSASPALGAKPSGLLAKRKEGLRKASDKIKDKEIVRPKIQPLEGTSYTESLQAFLRIRPPPNDAEVSDSRLRPYLEPQGDHDVLMRAPIDPTRPHASKPPHIYSFDRVYPPPTSQSTFFRTTTLPLVEKLLHGENGLLFAYGVSNSGKTYTISGANTQMPEDRGVLPRAVDVVFNSIAGMQSAASLRCTGLADVEFAEDAARPGAVYDAVTAEAEAMTKETVKLDKNFSYAVLVSYSEVYNEKIFDLLDAGLPCPTTAFGHQSRAGHAKTGLHRAPSAFGLSGTSGSSMSLAAMANGGGGVLTRKALALKNDPEGNGKYIAGLNEVRVRTRQEALAVFRSGQRARQVFGTLANRESSRSHGIFTIKVVRIHNGAPNDPDSARVSRLAIVDLAGSERTRNTQTTGDRLKEAGNINKSLMVLGQCLEVLRSNQQKMATPALVGTKKKLSVVPFRHSKLTEIFQNFFVGDGRAVMIVNVNPYDTGFDENAHVMRFSAVAREIQTTASNMVGGLRRQISTQFSAFRQAVSGPMKIKVVVPVLPKIDETARVGKYRDTQELVMVEEEIEVVEENDSEDEDDRDLLVEHLFEQLRETKTRLYESEMRNASIEVEVREEVAREMQETVQKMHVDFTQRFQDQVAASDLKADRKLDILSRTIVTPAVERFVRDDVGTPLSVVTINGESIVRAPDVESTVDESFASALDQSQPLIRHSILAGRMSDPFSVQPKNAATIESRQKKGSRSLRPELDEMDESLEQDSGSDIDEESLIQSAKRVLPSMPATVSSWSIRRNVREETVDSEDILGASLVEEADGDSDSVESGKGDGTDDTDSEADEEDVREADVGDDDEDEMYDEEEADKEEANESDLDSEFAMSDLESGEEGPSTEEEPPVRRVSVRRRTTASPVKAMTPAKAVGASSSKKFKKATSPKKIEKIFPQKKAVKPKEPLGESLKQDTASRGASVDSDGGDEEEEVFKPKKKRTLGKKIITEDEMMAKDVDSPGAAVRRLVRG